MLLYHPHFVKRFSDYGIAIPILDSRPRNVFEFLCEHPVLGPRKDEWLLDGALDSAIEDGLPREDLARVHDPAYVDLLLSDTPDRAVLESFELVMSNGRHHRYNPETATRPLKDLARLAVSSTAGSLACCRAALEHGFAYFLGGGTHHADYRGGRGFCLLNDVVVAARALQARGEAKSIWVVDVDAHKGDGTAQLTTGDASIRTLSIHMAEGWPLSGQVTGPDGCLRTPYWPSDIDLPVPEGGEDGYVDMLSKGLDLLEAIAIRPPDAAIVVAGADPYEGDVLPSSDPLKLSLEQCLERDQLVYDFLAARSIPQAWLMSGGYGPNVWQVHARFVEWALLKRLQG